MKKRIIQAYCLITVLFVFFFIWSMGKQKLNIKRFYNSEGFQSMTDYSMDLKFNEESPTKMSYVYSFVLGNVSDDFNMLFFKSLHCLAKVNIDGERVYELERPKSLLGWSSPGNVWNQLTLERYYSGKEVQIELIPLYDDFKPGNLEIYVGSQYDIIEDIMWKDFPTLVLSLFCIGLGVFEIITLIIITLRKIETHLSLMMSLFYIFAGAWKLMDTDTYALWGTSYPGYAVWRFLLLMLLSCPMIFAIREMCREQRGLWWLACLVNFANITVCLFLQVCEIADLRQTVTITHLSLCFTMACIIHLAIKNVRLFGYKGEVKPVVLTVGSAMIWMVFEMVDYCCNTTSAENLALFGMLGFIAHVFLYTLQLFRNMKEMMEVGMSARQYEKIAFHDQLTGFYNRAAMANYIDNAEFAPQECVVAVFDLNNLKKCNDSLGHDKGDEYIKESARIIRESFGDLGQCYRQGGDEFAVMMKQVSEDICYERVEEMKRKVAAYNSRSKDIAMGIACGFAKYDEREDETISDTAKRADKMMYQEKFLMKQQQK